MKSKFSGIFEGRGRDPEPPPEDPAEAPPPPSPAPADPPPAPAVGRDEAPAPAPARRRGRPPGKRSDGDYVQVTAYIRRDTHRAVKVALLTSGQGREFSELVQDLLSQWLESRS